jgi:hypothetical protein
MRRLFDFRNFKQPRRALVALILCTPLSGCLLEDDSGGSSDASTATAAASNAQGTASTANAASPSGAPGSSTSGTANAPGSATPPPATNLNPGNRATLTGGTFTPSYQLPGAGEAVAIGTNTATDIRPPELSATSWNYAVFGCFGGGAYVQDFSAAGAYVVAGTGGHTCPTNVGAAVFDFADTTWRRIDNANGIRYQLADFSDSQTNGAPYFELTAATAGQIPAPAHMYRTAVELPSRLGGGSRGSLLLVTRTAIARESKVSGAVHRFDLATGLWTRHINAIAPQPANYEGTTIFDAAEDKYWHIPDWLNSITKVMYLDARDWVFKETAAFASNSQIQSEPAYGAAFLDEPNRLLIYHRGARMVALSLKNPAAGWKVLALSQSAPPAGNRWVYYPPDGSFYYHEHNGGQTLHRLIPPTTDPLNGTWNLTTVSIKGAPLPNYSSELARHYNGLIYVPSIQMLAWVPGGSNRVVLIRPS